MIKMKFVDLNKLFEHETPGPFMLFLVFFLPLMAGACWLLWFVFGTPGAFIPPIVLAGLWLWKNGYIFVLEEEDSK